MFPPLLLAPAQVADHAEEHLVELTREARAERDGLASRDRTAAAGLFLDNPPGCV
jgi:hypothetical protein